MPVELGRPLRLLIIEDRPDDAELMVLALQEVGLQVDWRRVDTEADFRDALSEQPDAVLADYLLPGFNVLKVLEGLKQDGNDTPFLIVSGAITETAAVEAMRRGASDYLVKDRLSRLPNAIDVALEQRRLREVERRAERERREAEAAVRASEERFRLTLLHAPIGLALVGLDGRWLVVNPALCEIVGRSESELLASTFQEITHPDDIAADLGHVQELLDGTARSYQLDKRYLRPDGTIVWISLTVALVRDERGNPVHLISQIQDISQRRRADEALAAAQQLVRSAFEDAPCGVAMVGKDRRYLAVNDSLCALTGYDEAELLTMGFDDLTYPEDRGAGEDELKALQLGALERYKVEKRYVRKDGTVLWVEVNVSLVRTEGGEPSHYVAQIFDVADRHAAAVSLAEANEQLLRANELKDHVVAVTSHELRTPLTSILGFTDLLRRRWDRIDDSSRRDYLERIDRQGRRLQTMVGDLLTLSSIEAGAMTLEPEEVDVASLVAEVVADLSMRDVTVTCEPGTAHLDPDRLRQVLVNLLGNAISYGAPPYQVVSRCEADTLVLVVSDSGEGIPEEFVPRMFESFTQASTGRSRTAKGAGLGLSIVQRLVTLHGGTISYQPGPGGGAQFTVVLPAERDSSRDSNEVTA